jgi:hypothetical protein
MKQKELSCETARRRRQGGEIVQSLPCLEHGFLDEAQFGSDAGSSGAGGSLKRGMDTYAL